MSTTTLTKYQLEGIFLEPQSANLLSYVHFGHTQALLAVGIYKCKPLLSMFFNCFQKLRGGWAVIISSSCIVLTRQNIYIY